MNPQSQQATDENQLVQVQKSVSKTNKKGKKLSADAFDQGDESTHKDDDYDYDLAKAAVEKLKL